MCTATRICTPLTVTVTVTVTTDGKNLRSTFRIQISLSLDVWGESSIMTGVYQRQYSVKRDLVQYSVKETQYSVKRDLVHLSTHGVYRRWCSSTLHIGWGLCDRLCLLLVCRGSSAQTRSQNEEKKHPPKTVLGPVRGLRGGERGGWCEEWAMSGQDHPTFSYHSCQAP